MKNIIVFLCSIIMSLVIGFVSGLYLSPEKVKTEYIEKEVISYIPTPIEEKIDYGFINPIHEDDYIRPTSPYGIREIPKAIYTGGATERDHYAVDMVGTWRARIVASKSGIIKEKWYVPDESKGRRGHDIYGGYIVILHDDGTETDYAHCSEIYVHEGQRVEQGEVIARQGNSGLSAGPHLHFILRINGVPVNPLKYIDY